MAKIDTGNGTGMPGIVIKQRRTDDILGVAFQDARSAAPVSASDYILYRRGTSLYFWNGSSETAIGGSGAGGTPTWETIFASDATMTITPDNTFTIAGNRATATDVLTITNIGGGSGSCLQITNSGTGNDVDGTSNTWSVTKLGAASFLTLTLTGTTITSTGADLAWAVEDNDATALSIGANGITNMLVFDTRTGVEIVSVSAGGFAVVNGAATFASASNTVVPVTITNNTMTTLGAAANSAGALVVASTSLTTGSLLQLNLSDTANAGGFYLNCRETIGGTNDFTIGENGVVTMAGTASTTSFTMSLGNLVLTDGTVSITTTGTADVLAVNSGVGLLTNNALIVTGAGVHTGVTTGSYVYIAPTGLTTGTALSVTAAAADTSVAVVDIAVAALTSGTALRITPGSGTFTTGGKSLEINHGSAVAGNGITVTTTGAYTGTGMVLLTAGAATTGVLMSLVSTTGMTSGSLLRGTTSTAGAVATNGVFSFRGTGAFTSTAHVGLVDVLASAAVGSVATNATLVNIMATNGSQVDVTALNIEQTTTTTGFTGDFVRIVGTSTTGDSNLIAVTCASTSAGDALQITGNGLVAGTSTLVNLVHGTSVLGAGNSMLRITSTGADTGTTTGCLLDLASSTATAGTLVLMTSATMATGAGMVMTLAGLTTGVGLSMTHATAVIASGGSMLRLNSGGIDTATTTGCLLDLTSTASLAGTQILATLSGLTTGKGFRMVADALTSGTMIDLESSSVGMAGLYLRCYDGAAVSFSIGAAGATIIGGSAVGTLALTITAGDLALSSGIMASTMKTATLGAGITAIAATSNVMTITGDGGGNSVTTITGGRSGQLLTIIFVDANVTLVNDDGHGANTIDLAAAGNITSADDKVVQLVFDGTSWYQVGTTTN